MSLEAVPVPELLETDEAGMALRPPAEDAIDGVDWDVDNADGAATDETEAVGTGVDETIEMEMEPTPCTLTEAPALPL